ncbi:MAG: DinB family protein [Candidatus Zixiibacteriota bacterium]
MLPQIAPLHGQFGVNTWLVNEALKEIAPDQVAQRIDDRGNSIQFVVGHMLAHRYLLGELVGMTDKWPHSELFARGAKPRESSEYPPMAEIMSQLSVHSEKLMKTLESLDEPTVQAKSPIDLPTNDDTIVGTIAFLSLHDSYHAGQLAYIRRCLGCGQVVG